MRGRVGAPRVLSGLRGGGGAGVPPQAPRPDTTRVRRDPPVHRHPPHCSRSLRYLGGVDGGDRTGRRLLGTPPTARRMSEEAGSPRRRTHPTPPNTRAPCAPHTHAHRRKVCSRDVHWLIKLAAPSGSSFTRQSMTRPSWDGAEPGVGTFPLSKTCGAARGATLSKWRSRRPEIALNAAPFGRYFTLL